MRWWCEINIGFITNKNVEARWRLAAAWDLIRVSVVLSLIILDFNMTFISLVETSCGLHCQILASLLLIHPDTQLPSILYDDPPVKI